MSLHGEDYEATAKVAMQICLDQVSKTQKEKVYTARTFAFEFSSRDPSRSSLKNMVTASILQFSLLGVMDDLTLDTQLITGFSNLDKYRTDHSLRTRITISNFWLKSSSPLLLLAIDECDAESRKTLWSILSGIARKIERPVRLVVTSKRPGALIGELTNVTDIMFYEYALPPKSAEVAITIPDEDYQQGLVSRLCPGKLGEDQIRKSLDRLKTMEREPLEKMIHFIEILSNWPGTRSTTNLALFCSLMEDIRPSSTSTTILSNVFRKIDDQDGLKLVLTYLLSCYRPMTILELASLMCCQKQAAERTWSTPSEDEIQNSVSHVESLLSSFADITGGEVQIRSEVLDAINNGDDDVYIWNSVRRSAPQDILQFLVSYLSSANIQDRLNIISDRYELIVETSHKRITPPLEPDGRDFLYYAVQALPYHLSNVDVTFPLYLGKWPGTPLTELEMDHPEGRLEPWAKVFWAMHDSFSRMANRLVLSAWKTWKIASGLKVSRIMLSKPPEHTIGDLDVTSTALYSDKVETRPNMHQFIDAILDDDEERACRLAHVMIEEFNKKQKTELPDKISTFKWPSAALWGAIWFNMQDLVALMLKPSSNPPDGQVMSVGPQELYLAACLGHAEIIAILLESSPKWPSKLTDPKEHKFMYKLVSVAASCGHVDVVKILVQKFPYQTLKGNLHQGPLCAVTTWGAWETLDTLLVLLKKYEHLLSQTQEPPASRDTTHDKEILLVEACRRGYIKTVQVFLDHGVDPNAFSQSNGSTAISGAIKGGHIECLHMLLRKGANPNRGQLKRPLLTLLTDAKTISDEERITMFEILIKNDPPIHVDNTDSESCTPLMHAAGKGDLVVVRWMLDHGADINKRDGVGHDAMFHALISKKKHIVQEFLRRQVAPRLDTSWCSHGETHMEIAMGDAVLVEMLLDAGIDPEVEDENKQTALNFAVANHKLDVVDLLLKRKVDIHHRDSYGWSPLLRATGSRPNAQITRLLIENGANIADTLPSGRNSVHLVMQKSNPDVLRILLEFHKAINLHQRDQYSETPILHVREYSKPETLECLRLLVRAGANVNDQSEDGLTILIRCAGHGKVAGQIYNYLLGLPEIDVNLVSNRFGSALHQACFSVNLDLVSKLLALGAEVNVKRLIFGCTPLIAACIPFGGAGNSSRSVPEVLSSMENIVRELVAKGADVKFTGGHTVENALSAASMWAGVGTINYLVDKIGSVHIKDPLNRQPLHFAAANGIRNFEAVTLAYDGDIMATDVAKKNILHWAAQFGHVETIRAILGRLSPDNKDKYINAGDIDGWTPLAWATRPLYESQWLYRTISEAQNYKETIQCLLEEGADVSVKFSMGQGDQLETFTALEMARLCEAEDDIVQLLTAATQEANRRKRKETGERETRKSISGKKYIKRRAVCDVCLSVS